ncbi:MAG: nucleotidyltransferase family protein [Rhodospirillales bacterium]|nr:nucleotidyltransferase family protein [Rhodospirillales bacterium]
MTVDIPKTAMVLSAGYGKRMRPLTDDTPKPMLALNGKPLIGHVMDRLATAGVKRAVVNLHYLGDQIKDYLAAEDRLDVTFTDEPELLETGGGVKNALTPLTETGTDPFYVVNSDAFWLDGYEDTLMRLAREWKDDIMDGLLLLHGTVESHGYTGPGDFVADPDGKLKRRPEMEIAPWLFAGVQILHPRIFDNSPDGKWSLNVVFDKAIESDRLYGVIHDGEWFHIGTPEGLKEADDFLNLPYAGEKKR